VEPDRVEPDALEAVLRNPQRAIEALTRAIERDPEAAEPYHLRGHAYEKLGMLEEARADYTRMIEKGGNLPNAYLDRGRINWFRHAYRPAAADYGQVLKLEPDSPLRGTACKWLAWLYVAAPPAFRDPHAALPLAEEAVRLLPGQADSLNTLGVVYCRLGRHKEAIEKLKKVVEMSGEATACELFFLAISHRELGHEQEAAACYRQAVALCEGKPNLDAEARDLLGRFRAETEAVLGNDAAERGRR
jgi:tetratricopeptide (TPR) repeat protein